jgi:hypothetical protein
LYLSSKRPEFKSGLVSVDIGETEKVMNNLVKLVAVEIRRQVMRSRAALYPLFRHIFESGFGYRHSDLHFQLLHAGFYTDLHRQGTNPMKSILRKKDTTRFDSEEKLYVFEDRKTKKQMPPFQCPCVETKDQLEHKESCASCSILWPRFEHLFREDLLGPRTNSERSSFQGSCCALVAWYKVSENSRGLMLEVLNMYYALETEKCINYRRTTPYLCFCKKNSISDEASNRITSIGKKVLYSASKWKSVPETIKNTYRETSELAHTSHLTQVRKFPASVQSTIEYGRRVKRFKTMLRKTGRHV